MGDMLDYTAVKVLYCRAASTLDITDHLYSAPVPGGGNDATLPVLGQDNPKLVSTTASYSVGPAVMVLEEDGGQDISEAHDDVWMVVWPGQPGDTGLVFPARVRVRPYGGAETSLGLADIALSRVTFDMRRGDSAYHAYKAGSAEGASAISLTGLTNGDPVFTVDNANGITKAIVSGTSYSFTPGGDGGYALACKAQGFN